MILIVHLLVGAVIVLNVKPLGLALILAFLSHYMLDSLPHWDYSIKNLKKSNWKKTGPEFLYIFFDLLIGVIVLFLLSSKFGLALLGGFIALIPDGLHLSYRIFPNKVLGFIQKKQQQIHFPENKRFPVWEITIELIILLAAIYCLL